MKLISPRNMNEKHERAYNLCLGTSRIELDHDEAIACLADNIDYIEKGARIIGRGLPITDMGKVDLVGKDTKGGLILIGLCKKLSPDELCRAAAKSEWAIENLKLIEHVYSTDLMPQARTWLLSEEIYPHVISTIPHLDTNALEIFMCEGIDLRKDLWLVVRKLKSGKRTLERSEKNLHSVLTREEIDDFFDVSGYGEEVTSNQ